MSVLVLRKHWGILLLRVSEMVEHTWFCVHLYGWKLQTTATEWF